MHSVLFVCTANICRSPMAMGLWRSKVEGTADEWRIDSAGIWAQRGLPAAQYTREVLRARGIALADYRSKPLSREMLEDFNLILAMEGNHREALRAAFPQHAGKIFLLSEMIDRFDDVVDPVGGPLADFEDTAREIETILEQGYERIYRLAADDIPAEQSQT
jgi:protein-tyrosine-phosphatase